MTPMTKVNQQEKKEKKLKKLKPSLILLENEGEERGQRSRSEEREKVERNGEKGRGKWSERMAPPYLILVER